MKPSAEHNSALPELMPELHDELLAILFGASTQRKRLLQELLARHPGHRVALAAHIEHDEQMRSRSADPALANAIPGYRIVEVLGEGGMGTVYLADQLVPLHRRVALKVIKLGMNSRQVVARFERERQTLAMMDHDAIAKVFDCGLTASGQPFFAMELVHGVPLARFCEEQQLPLRERLLLVQQVCAGVQHAHQKGVIHRDLKPGNVLVSRIGDRLQVKIIDFGLAKALAPSQDEGSLFTEAGQIVGTPEYMAPEQADPTNADIDTRADVYSLGVMLYELLVGDLPFSRAQLREAGMLEVQRILREVEPPKPSTRLSEIGERPQAIARARGSSLRVLQRVMKHDLDWVVLKAIEKDRRRRYETADALAADLRRFLEHEPLVAGPPSATYRLGKLLRRHRGQVIAVAAVVGASITFGGVALVQYGRAAEKAQEALIAKGKAEASAQEARDRADELEKVSSFQAAQLAGIDVPFMAVRLRRSVIDSSRVEQRSAVEAGLQQVSFVDLSLGLLWEQVFERALKAAEAEFAELPLVKARLLRTVAETMRALGMGQRAAAPQAEALAIRRRLLGDEHADTLESISSMGVLLHDQGMLTEAEPLLRDALAKYRLLLGEEHPHTLTSIHNLGLLLQAQGKMAEAEELVDEALEKNRQVHGEEHLQTLASIIQKASFLAAQGRLAEAEQLSRGALEKSRRALGEEHSLTLASIGTVGNLLREQGRMTEAETFLRESLEKNRRVLGEEHPWTLSALNNVGLLLVGQGNVVDAEPLLREGLDKSRRLLGEEHQDTLVSILNLGTLLQDQGRVVDAEALLREGLDKSRRVLGEDSRETMVSIHNLARLLQDQGRFAEAEPLLREALEKSRRVHGDQHLRTLLAVRAFASLLARTQRPEAAVELLEPALASARAAFRAEPLRLSRFLLALGQAHTGFGAPSHLTTAEQLLLEAHQISVEARGGDGDTRACVQALVDLYVAMHAIDAGADHDAKAAEWRAKLAAPRESEGRRE